MIAVIFENIDCGIKTVTSKKIAPANKKTLGKKVSFLNRHKSQIVVKTKVARALRVMDAMIAAIPISAANR